MRATEDVFVRAMVGFRVNRVAIGDREVRKTRRLGAGVAIACGNVYFRLAGALFRMFPTVGGWIHHEARMFEALHRQPVRRDGRTLVMPRLPGRDLYAVLADETSPHALAAAGRALAAIHARGISHGDVNLGNFIWDGRHAALIDFDAAHDDEHPIDLRAADDVLGLTLDLARLDGDFEQRLAWFLEGYHPPAAMAHAFAGLSRTPGFLAASLLRARAHAASSESVEWHLAIARALLERREGSFGTEYRSTS